MIVSIHQPNYLPYLGYFNKINDSDIFVIYDTAQYVKNGFDNKNKIRTKDGFMYLTIPLRSSDCYKRRFSDVKLPENCNWQSKHWKAIHANYAVSEYYNDYASYLEKIYNSKWKMLVEISEAIIRFMIKELSIDVQIIKASELQIDTELKSTDKLIQILKQVSATKYISGPSGKNYMETGKFKENNIELIYQDFTIQEYKQRYPGFIGGLSAIDLLFNQGKKSKNYI